MKCPANDVNSANSNSINIITNGQKNRISWKKKNSIKPKGKSSLIALVEKNDISRWKFELDKLINISGEIVIHSFSSL